MYHHPCHVAWHVVVAAVMNEWSHQWNVSEIHQCLAASHCYINSLPQQPTTHVASNVVLLMKRATVSSVCGNMNATLTTGPTGQVSFTAHTHLWFIGISLELEVNLHLPWWIDGWIERVLRHFCINMNTTLCLTTGLTGLVSLSAHARPCFISLS